MGVESKSNAERALLYARDDLGINPEMVVHDFSPNLTAAVKSIFGEGVSCIDPFHVMQRLNILAEACARLVVQQAPEMEPQSLAPSLAHRIPGLHSRFLDELDLLSRPNGPRGYGGMGSRWL